MRDDFIKRLEDCKYLLIKPHEIRKKYTEYVWQNRPRALLPSRPLKRNRKESGEEIKGGRDDASEASKFSNTYR
jgi:hypothetical protein